jgi:hypothetical protein
VSKSGLILSGTGGGLVLSGTAGFKTGKTVVFVLSAPEESGLISFLSHALQELNVKLKTNKTNMATSVVIASFATFARRGNLGATTTTTLRLLPRVALSLALLAMTENGDLITLSLAFLAGDDVRHEAV